ncbi:PspC domain-containing protein [Actinomadura sp. 7K507]|uniref:PspC domain-containing protein n=1 Tax=Actinomadura sp. 7K507 TaxID=2530365 RepID=UPI001043372B|nr:PspC domain-containing protein [Actinomadura sp. 7K507]TDC77302.1 PspC domain-containing protein [Actinomadura sp. 7K507]
MDMEKNTTGTTDKKLRRTHDGRMLAGVCSGAARYLGIDANIIRLGLAVFTLFGGAGIALYAIAWVIIPEEGAPKSIAEDLFKKASDSPTVQDAVQKSKDAINKNKDRTHA